METETIENENGYIWWYFHRHLARRDETRVDECIVDMEKNPGVRAERTSFIALDYIKTNISNPYCQVLGLLLILNARHEIGLPLLDDVVNDCNEIVKNIESAILRNDLERRIDSLLFRYDNKEEPDKSTIYCAKYALDNISREVGEHFDNLVEQMQANSARKYGIFWKIFLYVRDNINDHYCQSLLLLLLIGKLKLVNVHVLLRIMKEVDKNMVNITDKILYKDIEHQLYVIKHS